MNVSRIINHLIFWLLFLLLWSVHDLNYHGDVWDNIENNVFAFVPYVLLVYFNLYVLMPLFLWKKRIAAYVALLILSIMATIYLASIYLSFYFENINVYLPTARFFASMPGKIAIGTEAILALCLSMTLVLADEWFIKERSLKEVEQKQLETELNLLKNQINPHFLFNSLNSIYVMLSKDPKGGKEMLLQFSEILHHQLYETKKKRIQLAQEFENLQNYIAIEKIRHEDLVTVNCTFPENVNGSYISPMLLLPLVENAFKHGQSSQGYWINIKAMLEHNNRLRFTVENSVANQAAEAMTKDTKGIGLANVKRRLELIYPNKHLFHIAHKNGTFMVDLSLQLDE